MIDFKNIPNLYFLGIGGIGMSALARFANALGKNVAGYDLTQTPLTLQLETEGIDIHYTDDILLIPSDFGMPNTLVVRTPAVPDVHAELQYLRNQKYQIIKRSELLGFLTNNRMMIAVAGTHGKTSVTTMITHLIHESKTDVGAFLGGISRNFNSNLVLPQSENSMVVTEADEYDRSFLQLHPTIAVVTSVDADHLDIYGSYDKVIEAFGLFVENVVEGGKLLYKKGVKLMHYMPCSVDGYSYSIEEKADFYIQDLHIVDGAYYFDLYTRYMVIHDMCMVYPGKVNLENMLAAAAAAILAGIDPMEIKKAMLTFRGVTRRFDVRFKNDKLVYIDDYAHHPKELEATILSVKELYAGKKVLGIFQPHLFSRTVDFAKDFAQSLDLLDEAILLDIYPAREKAIPGVSSETIFRHMKLEQKTMTTMADVLTLLPTKEYDVLLTMGAGNIVQLVEPITKMLNEKIDKE